MTSPNELLHVVNPIFLDVFIEGMAVKGLEDSGASNSTMDEEYFANLTKGLNPKGEINVTSFLQMGLSLKVEL